MTDILRIYDELQALGITANYKGRRQAALAIQLALEDEDRLDHVTKEIYWKVADLTGCNRIDIERNLRTVSHRAWKVSRPYLLKIAHYDMLAAPTASEFISIVASHIKRSEYALSGQHGAAL